jgi:hypothetical protein
MTLAHIYTYIIFWLQATTKGQALAYKSPLYAYINLAKEMKQLQVTKEMANLASLFFFS